MIELFPMPETEFFSKVIEAEIRFVGGDDGRVTELILRQGGRKMPAKRLPD